MLFVQVDSYSAFFNNGGFEKTELQAKLDELQVGQIYLVGIALDYCVFWSAMDSKKLGYDTYVIQDATKGITIEGIGKAVTEMTDLGIQLIQSDAILSKDEL